jgi:hypothetical protein
MFPNCASTALPRLTEGTSLWVIVFYIKTKRDCYSIADDNPAFRIDRLSHDILGPTHGTDAVFAFVRPPLH